MAASSNTRFAQLTGAIITTHYRYKRPPRKQKAVEIEAPAIVPRCVAKPAMKSRARHKPDSEFKCVPLSSLR